MEWDYIGNQPINPPVEVIRDSYKTWITEQIHVPIDLFFIQLVSIEALAVVGVADQNNITLVNAAAVPVGAYLGLVSGDDERFYFGEVIAKAVNVLTMDAPLDFAFPLTTTVINTTRDLNVNGLVTRQDFNVRGPGVGVDQVLDIHRILIQITTNAAPSFNAFGDIVGGLLKGIVLRQNNGLIKNIWTVKTNREFANLAYDYTTYAATNPGQGVWGLACRYTFNGPDKHGTPIRLNPDETLDLLIQDDLSSLLSFRIIAEGKIVNNSDL